MDSEIPQRSGLIENVVLQEQKGGDEMALVIERAGYETLRDQIVHVLQAGKERAQRAVEEETLRTYHEIGCLLNDYV